MLKSVKNQKSPQASVDTLPRAAADPARVAVILNRNARRVTDHLARRLESVVGSDNFFYSHSLEEAEEISREVVQRGYGTVVCGGGDGTLMQTVNLVARYANEANAWRRNRADRFGEDQTLLKLPRFGLLKLGTGNGLSRVVGSSSPARDLRRLVDFSPGRSRELSLVESGGDRFFFGGLGYDSMVLNDFKLVKEWGARHHLGGPLGGIMGYLIAGLFRTSPRVMFGGNTKACAHVRTRGRAYYIDPRRGDWAEELAPGTMLFEGRASNIAAGTTPYYGYGFKMFPFAAIRPGMMHLRITTLSPLHIAAHLPSIWTGAYRNPEKIYDFLVEDVSVELDRPYPFQHSGDSQGLRKRIEFSLADETLQLVDFYPARRFLGS